MPALPISYSELHNGVKPTDSQLAKLICPFNLEPTFISLVMWNLMISLAEGNAPLYRYLQGFFIHNLIREDLRDLVFALASLDSKLPRPVFGRWQLMALMKKVLVEASNQGAMDPRHDNAARRTLGDACLMMTDLLFPQEQDARLNAKAGDREAVGDELMAQFLFQFEMHHPPDVYQAIGRNDEYLHIFDQRADLRFGAQTLVQKFAALTGLDLRQYLRLYFSIWVLHDRLRRTHPDEINANPSIINFDKQQIFTLMDLASEELDTFFDSVLADLPTLKAGVEADNNSGRLWQFDFKTFRDYPLIYNSDSKQGFTCIAYPFLIEKLASGLYHTILNSWPENDPQRNDFQRRWGSVFEQFANDRLREESARATCSFYANPHFGKKEGGEVADAVLDCGDSLILLEHKGGYLSLDEKYGGDVDKLLKGVAKKFGVQKAIRQLLRSTEKVFNSDVEQRDTFSELDAEGRPRRIFTVDDARRIRTVYPVVVVQDFSMTIGFMNRRLRLQFEEKLDEISIDSTVAVRALSLLTIENLEDVLEHLDELKFTEVLDEYAKDEHSPLISFDSIFKELLRKRGIQQRRYRWTLKRGEEFFNSIIKQFKTDLPPELR